MGVCRVGRGGGVGGWVFSLRSFCLFVRSDRGVPL